MRVVPILLALVLICCASCSGNQHKTMESDNTKITRIKISENGNIYLNGSEASLEEVKKNFEKLKTNNGTVRYYRENPAGEPPDRAMNVMHLLVDAKLPIKLCATEQELNETDK